MSSSHNASSLQSSSDAGESQPLVQPLKQGPVGTLCFATILTGLVVSWCVLDSWNHNVQAQLFGFGQVKGLQVSPQTGNVTSDIERFEFPLTLAFLQFAFMGLAFSALWWAFSRDPVADLHGLKESMMDKTFAGMVFTHMFSTFWLQSMIMPQQMMSIGIFAASRSVEVPATAVLRSQALGVPLGRTRLASAAMMCTAAWLIFYSYTQIAECLCIWSGHGVELSGVALYFVYALVLILPAANAVCQESLLVQFQTQPLLLLAAQNIMACICFAPVLVVGHCGGFEKVGNAFLMITHSPEVAMLVLWLCMQMTLLSAVGIAVLWMLDSFWAVAFRSLRVLYWWSRQLFNFYFFSHVLLSVARPTASFWSFLMLCGLLLAGASFVIDQRAEYQNQKGLAADASSLPGPGGAAWKAI